MGTPMLRKRWIGWLQAQRNPIEGMSRNTIDAVRLRPQHHEEILHRGFDPGWPD
jgi:hypothetical protein